VPFGLPPAAEPGAVLAGRYQVGELLGWGASGFVLRAQDQVIGTPVALKLLRAELASDAAALERLGRELKVARALAHPHVCRVFELVLDGAGPFLVMELASHPLLDELRAEESAGLDQRLRDAVGLADGLAAMHRAGIIHRDIKPGNVLRMNDGRLTLSDFGLASLAPDASRMTVMVGTPRYMAPEVLAGEPASKRSDVLSLALVIHELVFRAPPVWSRRGRQRQLERPAGLTDRRERALLELCREALSALPDDRPGDGGQLHQRLVAVAAGRGRTLPRATLRRRALLGAGAAALAGAAVWYKIRHRPWLNADGVPEVQPPPHKVYDNASRPSFGTIMRTLNRSPQEGFWIVTPEAARTLLSEDGQDAQISPDDRTVAFVRAPYRDRYEDEEIWLLDAKLGRRQFVALGGCPRWSAEGKTLYFHDHRTRDLMAWSPDRPTDAPVLVYRNSPSAYPVFLPDDRRLLLGGENAVRIVDRTNRRELFRWSVPGRHVLLVGWRADDKVIAFASLSGDPIGLWVIDTSTGRGARVGGNNFISPVFRGNALYFDYRKTGARSVWGSDAAPIDQALAHGVPETEFVAYLQRRDRAFPRGPVPPGLRPPAPKKG
jgi:serine/threonine protein kinase